MADVREFLAATIADPVELAARAADRFVPWAANQAVDWAAQRLLDAGWGAVTNRAPAGYLSDKPNGYAFGGTKRRPYVTSSPSVRHSFL